MKYERYKTCLYLFIKLLKKTSKWTYVERYKYLIVIYLCTPWGTSCVLTSASLWIQKNLKISAITIVYWHDLCGTVVDFIFKQKYMYMYYSNVSMCGCIMTKSCREHNLACILK